MLRAIWPVLAVTVVLPAAACSSGGSDSTKPTGAGSPASPVELTRVSEAGGVAVEGTWLTAEELSGVKADLSRYPLGQFVLVEITFTTHSGDLSKIDMEQASRLSQGGTELGPQAWMSTSDDSHHRAGVLVFPRTLKDGPVELAIEIEGKKLSLFWETAPAGAQEG